jgi:DNA-binding CsgD family transcriptional regulator
VLRLADLRARQGRLAEARHLLAGFEEHEEAVAPRARVHLADGEPELARAVLERHLAHHDRGIVDAPALALLVQAMLACGARDAVDGHATRLAELADAIGLAPLTGLATLARGRVAAAVGGDDAAMWFERAMAAFADAHLPFDLARARLEYAELLAEDRPEVARAEAPIALVAFEGCGAARDVDAAARLLRRLGDRRRAWPRGSGTLSARETEVLGLLAEGLSNDAIAERLFISPRTAEHHVGNILAKLGLRNRAEAAAYGVRHG